MFTGRIIAACFIVMFAVIGVFSLLEKRNAIRACKMVLVVGLLASLYCVASGVFLAGGWQDPFINANSQQIARASVQGRGRGGLIILAIRYWPYVLLGLGGFFSFSYFTILVRLKKVS